MKTWLLAVAAPCWLAAGSSGPAPNALRKPGETTVFFFVTKSGKSAVLCGGPQSAYLVYRFDTTTHLELQYPVVLDGRSWRRFAYEVYHRGGGAHNAGRDTHRLFFGNGHTSYALPDETEDLYDKQHGEIERRTVGISVYEKGKATFIAGREASADWYLYLTEEQQKKVARYDGQYWLTDVTQAARSGVNLTP